MRFNNRRDCLDMLDHGVPQGIEITISKFTPIQKIETIQALDHGMKLFNKAFSNSVRYLTKPFYEAYGKNRNKIKEALEKEVLGEMSGVMILNVGAGITKTVFYWFSEHEPMKPSCSIMSFTRDEHCTALDFALNYYKETSTDPEEMAKGEMVTKSVLGDAYYQLDLKAIDLIGEWYLLLRFLKFCEIETKIIEPKEKYRTKGIKYFNETKRKIEILDSSWFTDIIRTDGFLVHGHLRVQAYGPQWSQKRLIYVNDFQKKGYVRKAKVRNENL